MSYIIYIYIYTYAIYVYIYIYPICSMYGITYIWVIFRANVGKYSIHGAYGYTIQYMGDHDNPVLEFLL